MLLATVDSGGLTLLDWSIIVLYAAGVIGLGWYYSRKQKSTEDYFLGGGNMNPTLIGISIFATLVSTISYLSHPGELAGKGPVILANMLGLPIGYLIVGYVLIPLYMRRRATSAYELLEEKLGVGIRLLGGAMFIVLRLTWMSLLIFMAAKAMVVMLGVGDSWIPLIALFTGLVAVIYTSLGGLRAVVITDLIQSILLFSGALMAVIMITIYFGGFGWFPTEWQSNWDQQPVFSFDPKTRVSMVGMIIFAVTYMVCTSGGDQVSVQRFMATRDAKAARKAYGVSIIVRAVVGIVLTMVGFALLGYFQANPGALPAGMSVAGNADDLFPRYIAYHLPAGVSGLVVAALFAAGMSSVDSGVNSITAVVTTDFLDRFGKRPKTEKSHILLARLLAFGIGTVVVGGACAVRYTPGNFFEVATKIGSLMMAPIFGLFFFAMFVPFAKPAGVWAGAVCGFATAVLIAFSGPIFGVDPVTKMDPVSFMWISPAALVVNIFVGTLVSLLVRQNGK